jgi:hypothetical protein
MPSYITSDAIEVLIDEPLLIRRILEHLNLWQERIPKGLPPPAELEDIADVVVCEAFDDGWSL